MAGTDPQTLVSAFAALISMAALILAAFAWYGSAAKKVRLVEDQVLAELRSYKARADQVDDKIGQWQVTVTDLLNQVEDFFERTVRERKRIQQQNARAAAVDQPPDQAAVDMSTLPRHEQLRLVDEHFRRMGN